MTEKSNTPAIRFKGFNDTWEQREFTEVFEILKNNTLSRADLLNYGIRNAVLLARSSWGC